MVLYNEDSNKKQPEPPNEPTVQAASVMTEISPKTDLGKDALNKINAALPKFKDEVNPLAAIVRSKLASLYEITRNPKLLAVHLQGMKMLTALDVSTIRGLKTDFERNQYIYDNILSDGHAAPKLIRALEETEDERVIREIIDLAAPAVDALARKVVEAFTPGVSGISSPTTPVSQFSPQSFVMKNGNFSLNTGAKSHVNQYQSTTWLKSEPTVISRGPVDLDTLKLKVERKILDLKINKVDNRYIAFFEEYEEYYLEKTARPDELAQILCDAKVLSEEHRDNVKSKTSNREKNEIIYDVIKQERKIDELITALEQIGDNDTLMRIEDTSSLIL